MFEPLRHVWIVMLIGGLSGAAQAIDFDIGPVSGTLNSRASVGAAVRVEDPNDKFIGKQNLNPDLCGLQHCMSFTGDLRPNQTLLDAPGAFFGTNKDDGNLNYRQGDFVSAITKLGSDLSGRWGEDGPRFELGGFVYFDPVNASFDERHPDTTFQPSRTPRANNVDRQLGAKVQLKRALVAVDFDLFDREFSTSIGYQRIRWGEATYNVLNSLDQINPPSAVLLHQPGTRVADVFLPTPTAVLNAQLTEGVSLQLVAELGWRPVVPDPGGSFGIIGNTSYDAIESDFITLTQGQAHEDPDGLQRLGFPGNAISETSFTARLLDESKGYPRDFGQFGAKLSWYLADFNGGTELNFYALNYHSQLPYFSVNAAQQSCARDSTSFVSAFVDCNGFIGLNPSTGLEPVPLDTLVGRFEYPEDIQMFGTSFNTTVGKWSLAGEYSFRPNLPLQVSLVDVVYSGWQPAFPRQDITLGVDPNTLLQTAASLGPIIGGIATENPQQLAADAIALLRGLPAILSTGVTGPVTVPSSRRAVPDFLSVYRGDEVQPGQLVHGYERFAVDQIGFTAIRAIGSSENPVGADQILALFEVGVTHVWNLPSRKRLQLEGGDANNTHASPGVDGTGADGVTDASRVTPTQQTKGFATSYAGGYRIMAEFEYDNLVWGLTFRPSLMFGHDVFGIAPQPIQNFVRGTKLYTIGNTVEIGAQWSALIYYQGSNGGGTVNNSSDRDTIGASLAYTF